MEDGRLLVPSNPAMTIDQVFYRAALGAPGVSGEVWLAESIVDKRSVYYLFAADVSEEHSIYPADLSLDPQVTFRAFETGDTSNVVEFTSSQPLNLKQSEEGEFVLWTVMAVESNGMSVQGEVDKWIGVSEARFSRIEAVGESEMVVEVVGVAEDYDKVN